MSWARPRVSPLLGAIGMAWLLVACTRPEQASPEGDEATESEPGASPAKTSAKPSTKPSTKTSEHRSPQGKPGERETIDGYEVIRARTADGTSTDLSVKPPAGWQVVQPPDTPDPHAGRFTLEQALEGLPPKDEGTLLAAVHTSLGRIDCELYERRTPTTVANFVGLARGLRRFWDQAQGAWVGRNYYDKTTFHRVLPGFMIQGGDHTGTGRGLLGYMFPDEVVPDLTHDRAGQLCMANRGPNTNAGQFFITDGAAPHLDGSYTIFGQCAPLETVYRIARVPQSGPPHNRPRTPVVIQRVEIRRVAGGLGAIARGADEPRKNTVPGTAPPGRAVPRAAQPSSP